MSRPYHFLLEMINLCIPHLVLVYTCPYLTCNIPPLKIPFNNKYYTVTSSSATLTSSNITNIINENKLHSQRKQQQQNPNIWNNIRGSFKLNNNTSSSSGLGGGIGGGGGQKQKTIYNSITGGLGLDGSLHTMSNLGSIREEGSDEEDEDPVSYMSVFCFLPAVLSYAHLHPLLFPICHTAHGSYGLSRR